MAGLQPELADEFALRPAIALAEWMSCIKLPEKPGGAPREPGGIEAGEVVFGGEFLQNLLQRRFEEGGDSEKMAALGYVDRPKLSRPFVNVPENVSMNRLEVRDVEFPATGVSINSEMRR